MLALILALLAQCSPLAPATPLSTRTNILVFGDSKSVVGSNTWHLQLKAGIEANRSTLIGVYTIATAGATVATRQATVDADLAAVTETMSAVLVDLGANDVAALPAEADWKANLAYILDAFHAKWPSAVVYVARAWKRGEAADCNTLAAWIADVISTHSWARPGHDERVWLEGGDDGATMTTDGVHYSAAGHTAAAAQWKTDLGY